MEEKYLECKKILERHGQQHLLSFYDELDINEKENLLTQIENIDFDKIDNLFKITKNEEDLKDDNINSIKSIIKDDMSCDEINKNTTKGEDLIRKNKLSVITMAGGQGTRLGHTGPKGTYMLNIDGEKSLFEIFCNRIKEASNKYNAKIHWYIMTSEENNDDTVEFFERNKYFKYGKENISFFKQGQLPMLDMDGKIILESKYKVKMASDGNGGIFEALVPDVINKIKKDGVEWVYVFGIDNILAEMIDPLLLGLSVNRNVKLASKTILKVDPAEKAGVYCMKNGKPAVIEYTEITEELRNKRKENGELELCELNIVSNLFSVKLLEDVCSNALPYHVANKKCDYIDNRGESHIAESPNAYKFETYIFDIYNYIDSILLLRVKRKDEFSPIKNKEGIDSPETAIKMYRKKYSG